MPPATLPAWFTDEMEERRQRFEDGLCIDCGERPRKPYSWHCVEIGRCPDFDDGDDGLTDEARECDMCGGPFIPPHEDRASHATSTMVYPKSWIRVCGTCSVPRGLSQALHRVWMEFPRPPRRPRLVQPEMF